MSNNKDHLVGQLTNAEVTIGLVGSPILDISHLNHVYIGGKKKSVMWRNFRFQYMPDVEKSEISPHEEEYQFSLQNMWRNMKFCQIWRNFTFLYRTNVKKSDIYPVFGCKICFTLFLWDSFWRDLRAFAWGKLSKKMARWRKNDKYQVWGPQMFKHRPQLIWQCPQMVW